MLKQTLITEYGRKRLQQLQNQRKSQGSKDSEPSTPLQGILNSTASLMHGLTMVGGPLRPSTLSTSMSNAPAPIGRPRSWTEDKKDDCNIASMDDELSDNLADNLPLSMRNHKEAEDEKSKCDDKWNQLNNNMKNDELHDAAHRNTNMAGSRAPTIMDLSRRIMLKLKLRGSKGDDSAANYSAMTVKMRNTLDTTADDEKDSLMSEAERDDLCCILSPSQMTAIAETEESEVDDIFSPVTACSNVLSPSNILSPNSTTTKTTPLSTNKNFADYAIKGSSNDPNEQNSIDSQSSKMKPDVLITSSRSTNMTRICNYCDVSTQVSPEDFGVEVRWRNNVRLFSTAQPSISRRYSFDPRLARHLSPKEVIDTSQAFLTV